MVTISNPDRTGRRGTVWSGAAALALLLHAGVAVLVVRGGALDPRPLPEPEPDVVRVVFAPREEPQAFTELPEDRAEEPADDPDFLSNVDSRARDETAGGDESLPQSDGVSDIPQVEMRAASDPVPPSAETTPAPEAAPTPPSARSLALASRLSDPVASLMTAPSTPAGAADVPQEAMRNIGPGAALQGEISLSTTAWDYAWWVQSFRRTVWKNWSPPSGFRFGLIGGWTLVEIEVSPDGKLMRADILDTDGHKALHEASVRAFTRSGGFDALPRDFPDETLVVRVRMIYSLRR